MARNPYTQVIGLLKDNWEPLNTDGVTPEILRTTEQKRIDFAKNTAFVLIGRFKPNQPAAGISYLVYHEYMMGTIDIRVYKNEDTYLKVCHEVQRILESNFNLFTDTLNDYDLIDIDGDQVELSDDYNGVFRLVRPVKLIKLSVQRGV